VQRRVRSAALSKRGIPRRALGKSLHRGTPYTPKAAKCMRHEMGPFSVGWRGSSFAVRWTDSPEQEPWQWVSLRSARNTSAAALASESTQIASGCPVTREQSRSLPTSRLPITNRSKRASGHFRVADRPEGGQTSQYKRVYREQSASPEALLLLWNTLHFHRTHACHARCRGFETFRSHQFLSNR
jgi:hypothetical protein